MAVLAVLVLIVLNGLFVAAEFAVVSARGPALDERVASGDRRAMRVAAELERLPFFLSTVQFGITATSLLVGFLADRAIGDTFVRPVLLVLGVSADVTLAVSVTTALLLSTIVQMVLGELFPKNVAISRPLEVARALGGFSRSATFTLGPIVRVFDSAAEHVTRWLFRVETPLQLDDAPGLDELARIIAASGARGSLSVAQTELLRRAVSLGVRRVGEVMIPRPDVEWLTSGATLDELAAAAVRTGHSRFPVRGGSEDIVLGTVHVKDLMRVDGAERTTTTVDRLVVPPLFVPVSETLRRTLDELRRQQRTFAVVVDEFGSTAGIVTLEDVLEALVGDIEDEFDRRVRRPVGGGRIAGSTTVGRFAERFGVALPEGPYETVAGFIMDALGQIPQPGASVDAGALQLTVMRREGLRITEVTVRPRTAGAR